MRFNENLYQHKGITMKTLLLDQDKWDLVLDVYGNIALADDPYAIAQNVASACRTWAGECWYNTAIGLPWQNIFGESGQAPLGYLRSSLENEASRVPGVSNAEEHLIFDVHNRTVYSTTPKGAAVVPVEIFLDNLLPGG